MYLRVLGTAVLNITLSLYILDHIRRVELVRSEPLRLSFSVVSWTAGPYLGIWLYANYGHAAPQIASIIGAVRAAHHVLVFAALRQSGDQGGAGAAGQPVGERRPLHGAAAPAACLDHRLRPLLLLVDLFHLCAAADDRGRPRQGGGRPADLRPATRF